MHLTRASHFHDEPFTEISRRCSLSVVAPAFEPLRRVAEQSTLPKPWPVGTSLDHQGYS